MNSLFLHGFFVLFASLELSWGHFSGNFQEIPSQEVLRGGPFWEVGETSSIILNTSISCIMCIVAVLQESFSFRILTMIHVLNNEKNSATTPAPKFCKPGFTLLEGNVVGRGYKNWNDYSHEE